MKLTHLTTGLLLAGLMTGSALAADKIVIAHRGASGYLPLPAYATDVNQLYDVLYNQAGVDGLFTDFPDKAVDFIHRK